MDRRGGGGMTAALLLDRRFVGTRVDLTPDIFYAVAAVSIVERKDERRTARCSCGNTKAIHSGRISLWLEFVRMRDFDTKVQCHKITTG